MTETNDLINIIRFRKNKKIGTWINVKWTSMYPWIPNGSRVFIIPSDTYEVGQVVVFHFEDRLVIHRVLRKEELEDGNAIYHTKGDNNNFFDAPVRHEDVMGKVQKLIHPKTGQRVWENEDRVTVTKIILTFLSSKEGNAFRILQQKTSFIKLIIKAQLTFLKLIKGGLGQVYIRARSIQLLSWFT